MASPANDTPDAILTALAAERVRNTRFLNVARLAALAAAVSIEIYFHSTRTAYQGGSFVVYGLWIAAASFVTWRSKRSDAFAERAGLCVTLIDMPIFFLMMLGLTRQLVATGFGGDAKAVAAAITVYFALMILLTGALMERRHLFVGLCLGLVLQLSLQHEVELEPSVMAYTAVALIFFFAIAAAVGDRTVNLVTAITGEQLRRERLGRYFSPQIAQHLLEKGERDGRGEIRDVTVLFCDLRDFTARCEAMGGPQVVDLLNTVHEALVGAVFAHGGTLDKYMGDGLMAYFGAPLEQPDHAVRALGCAIGMQAAIAKLNERRTDDPLRLGIGVHSGRVVLGDIGAARRREFTIIGHTVNIAARLEQLTKELGVPILLSDVTRQLAGDRFVFVRGESIAIRGQAEPMCVFGIGEADRATVSTS